jgi:tetratricopeptide (TPR) repeat protein
LTEVPARLWYAPVLGLALGLFGCAGGSADKGAQDTAAALDAALQHGDVAFKDGEYADAAAAYESALKIDRDQPKAVAGLATCRLKVHQEKAAHDLLVDYLSRHPDDTAARLVLARALVRQVDFDAAAAEMRRVLEKDPDNLLAHYNLGFIAYKQNRYDEAEAQLERTVALRPDHPEAHYTLGLVYLAQGRNDQAVKELQEAIRNDPKHIGAHFNLAAAAARSGDMALAGKEQRAYADLSGRHKAETERAEQVKAQSLAAVQHMMAGEYPQALVEYRKLQERYPDYAPLLNDIARVQLRLGQRQEALATLKRAVDMDPRLSEPHYLLGNLYGEMGDAQASARELRIFSGLETIPEGKSGY